jgi:rhodanese-related sulfurtransferase
MPFHLSPSWVVLAIAVIAWLVLTRLGKITGERARSLVANGARLVDVRTEAEYAGGHLTGAVNVALGRLRTSAPELAADGRPVVVYCASGLRSARARQILRGSGVREVHDLGAMGRW